MNYDPTKKLNLMNPKLSSFSTVKTFFMCFSGACRIIHCLGVFKEFRCEYSQSIFENPVNHLEYCTIILYFHLSK